LLAVSVYAFASAVFTFLNPELPLFRVLLGAPLVLFVPGYALSAAVFPHRELPMLERALFVVGSSLALAVIGGVILNATPWGLRASTWAWFLSSITLGLCVVAWKQRASRTRPRSVPRPAFRWGEVWLMGCAVVLIALTFVVNQFPVPASGAEGYTMLWIQPDRAAGANHVQIGIESSELARTRYRLQLQLDGAPVQEWDSIELQSGETWQVRAEFPTTADAPTIQAVLYRADVPDSVYRMVSLTQ
jgi:uncharacterized membrane protein